MNETLLILASSLILAYGAFSRLAERSVVTPPMVFMLTGMLVSPMGLGLLSMAPSEVDEFLDTALVPEIESIQPYFSGLAWAVQIDEDAVYPVTACDLED